MGKPFSEGRLVRGRGSKGERGALDAHRAGEGGGVAHTPEASLSDSEELLPFWVEGAWHVEAPSRVADSVAEMPVPEVVQMEVVVELTVVLSAIAVYDWDEGMILVSAATAVWHMDPWLPMR